MTHFYHHILYLRVLYWLHFKKFKVRGGNVAVERREPIQRQIQERIIEGHGRKIEAVEGL